MADDTERDLQFHLGYNSGVAWIDDAGTSYLYYDTEKTVDKLPGSSLSVLSASITKTQTISTVASHYLPLDGGKQSLIKMQGTLISFQGNVNFQLTQSALSIFLKDSFFKRNSLFKFYIGDSQKKYVLYNCVWTSITINGEPGSMVNVSISFVSNNGYHNDFIIPESQSQLSPFAITDYVPYWKTGGADMVKFQLSFNRSVQPIYLNNSKNTPTYFRVGRMDVSANCTYFKDATSFLQPNTSESSSLTIYIGGKNIKLKGAYMKTQTIKNDSAQDEDYIDVTYQSITDGGDIFTIE